MKDNNSKVQDPLAALRGFLVLDMAVRLGVWGWSMTLTIALFAWLGALPKLPASQSSFSAAGAFTRQLILMILAFNAIYVAILILFRLPITNPRPGRYAIGPGVKLDSQLIKSCFIAVLTKARYHAPFPGFLVFHAANLPPLCWLMSAVFGPKSRSCYVADPTILDPHLVTIGRNVVIGFGATIAGHYQESDHIVIQPTIIEDDVLIGGHAALSGVHIQRGAIIAAGSIVMPGSKVGPYEYWSGNPARRRRRVSSSDTPESVMHPREEGESFDQSVEDHAPTEDVSA